VKRFPLETPCRPANAGDKTSRIEGVGGKKKEDRRESDAETPGKLHNGANTRSGQKKGGGAFATTILDSNEGGMGYFLRSNNSGKRKEGRKLGGGKKGGGHGASCVARDTRYWGKH